jgi:hypothetical protein
MNTTLVATGLGIAFFAAIAQLLLGLIRPDTRDKPWWWSLSGGILVAFAVMYVLPDLAEHGEIWLCKRDRTEGTRLPKPIYVTAIFGLLITLAIDRAGKRALCREDEQARRRVLWKEVSTAAVSNFLIGYMVGEVQRVDLLEATLIILALCLFLLVNHLVILSTYRGLYRSRHLLCLALGVFAGAAVQTFMQLPEIVVAALTGLLAGNTLIKGFKDEIPGIREDSGHFWPFAGGLLGYTCLLLVVYYAGYTRTPIAKEGSMNVWQVMAASLTGKALFRLIVQSAMAIFVGVKMGRQDAREGRLPFLQRLCTEAEGRGSLFNDSMKRVLLPFAIAMVIEAVVEFMLLRTIHPLAVLLVGGFSVWLPFVLTRDLTDRFLQGRVSRACG